MMKWKNKYMYRAFGFEVRALQWNSPFFGHYYIFMDKGSRKYTHIYVDKK